jgi:hypothetical protein
MLFLYLGQQKRHNRNIDSKKKSHSNCASLSGLFVPRTDGCAPANSHRLAGLSQLGPVLGKISQQIIEFPSKFDDLDPILACSADPPSSAL